MVHFLATDIGQHALWKHQDPTHPAHDPAQAAPVLNLQEPFGARGQFAGVKQALHETDLHGAVRSWGSGGHLIAGGEILFHDPAKPNAAPVDIVKLDRCLVAEAAKITLAPLPGPPVSTLWIFGVMLVMATFAEILSNEKPLVAPRPFQPALNAPPTTARFPVSAWGTIPARASDPMRNVQYVIGRSLFNPPMFRMSWNSHFGGYDGRRHRAHGGTGAVLGPGGL